MTSKVIWCDRGWVPYYYGFCPDEGAWNREMRRLSVSHPYPITDGACTNFAKYGDDVEDAPCSIVTINDKKRPSLNITSLMVHEATHVWRHMRESMGEDSPSSEFEAYAMQNIVHNLLSAYEKSRKRLFR